MSKPEKNYFYVNRALLNSDRWLSEPFTRGQAWLDLFGLAQYKDGYFRSRGIKIEIKRGQLGYSQVTLAQRWKWSRNKVRRFLKELEKNKDISLKTKHQNCDVTTVITVLKYNKWQGMEHQTEHQTEHQKDTKRNTYNKDNKDKKDNKDSFLKNNSFTILWEEYLLMRKKLKKPMTDKAKELAIKKLHKLSNDNIEIAKRILEMSIMNSWQGLFPLKPDEVVGEKTPEQDARAMYAKYGDNAVFKFFDKYGEKETLKQKNILNV